MQPWKDNLVAFPRDLFDDHVRAVATQWHEALDAASFDGAVIAAGSPENYFEDDQAPPFQSNPHFARIVPEANSPASVVVLKPGERPRLLFYSPADYWHAPPALPDWVDGPFEVELLSSEAEISAALANATGDAGRFAYIAAAADEPPGSNRAPMAHNPDELLQPMRYVRAAKTNFELDRMRAAGQRGVLGHRAARDCFLAGGSEFDIHLAYLGATTHIESELPYHNIIALNEHAAILHYQHYDRTPPATPRSFLIDAGANVDGYHSDITRTYSAENDEFAALIDALDVAQQAMIDSIKPAGSGQSYVDLHVQMHHQIGAILNEFGILKCSAESAFDQHLTDAFFPHGLGHLLGLQTHDVGGHFADATGAIAPPPERFPALRLTRQIEANHVFTIEPGIYFIPMLLDAIEARQEVDWQRVEAFLPYGGIRIEDNVAVFAHGVENLTRPWFEQLDA